VGVALGLTAALLWGLADYSAALASREVGALRVVLGFHVVAVVLLGIGVVATSDFGRAGGEHVLVLALVGAVGAVAYLSFYRALAIGPISIVSPVVSGYAATTVVLALFLLGESLSVLEAGAVVLAVGGVMLASSDLASVRKSDSARPQGVLLAILAMVTLGGFVFGLAYYAGDLGWLLPIFLGRASTLVVLALALAGDLRRSPRLVSARLLPVIVLLAVLDTGGYVAFNVGTGHADTAIVAGAAAPYAVVPIVLGVVLLEERPAALQWVGIVLVLVSVATLGLVAG
jgi:drug/metabolite transporter (DMT)-like permease